MATESWNEWQMYHSQTCRLNLDPIYCCELSIESHGQFSETCNIICLGLFAYIWSFFLSLYVCMCIRLHTQWKSLSLIVVGVPDAYASNDNDVKVESRILKRRSKRDIFSSFLVILFLCGIVGLRLPQSKRNVLVP